MLKNIVWVVCLVICACGHEPVATTSSVTNGDLVLGIVPVKGGELSQGQLYRMLVCKKLPNYNAQIFADQKSCRSALLAKNGGEVDFLGKQLIKHLTQDTPHLFLDPTSRASDIRVMDSSPIIPVSTKEQRDKLNTAIVIMIGIPAIGLGTTFAMFDFLEAPPLVRVALVALAALGVLVTASAIYRSVTDNATKEGISRKERKRREHFGDDAGRNPATPVKVWPQPEYSRADIITHRHLSDITSADFFRNMVSLEQEGDLRTILVSLARFFKIRVNEDALKTLGLG